MKIKVRRSEHSHQWLFTWEKNNEECQYESGSHLANCIKSDFRIRSV